MTLRLSFALVVAMTVVLLAGLPATAITRSFKPDYDHPYVGLIVFYDEDEDFSHRCSGSLIDSTTFITAGHCIDDEMGGVMTSARIWFNQSGGKVYDPVRDLDPNSGYPWHCYEPATCATSHEMYDYGFRDLVGYPNTRDVGVVILEQPMSMPGGEYGSLAPPGYLDRKSKGAKGGNDLLFRASGFGLSYARPFRVRSLRERIMADGKLVNKSSANNRGFNLQLQGNGKDRGGTCRGDSGGPVFHPKASNQIVAVISFGMNADCRSVDFAYRLDRGDVQQWIESVS